MKSSMQNCITGMNMCLLNLSPLLYDASSFEALHNSTFWHLEQGYEESLRLQNQIPTSQQMSQGQEEREGD